MANLKRHTFLKKTLLEAGVLYISDFSTVSDRDMRSPSPLNEEDKKSAVWRVSVTQESVNDRFRKKYAGEVRCYSLYEEEFSIIESRSLEINPDEIIRESDLITYQDEIQKGRTDVGSCQITESIIWN